MKNTTQYDSLVQAAHRIIANTKSLISSEETPFNVVYPQYKSLQSMWFRIIEEASENNSKSMENLCMELESVSAECEAWISRNSPTTGTRVRKERNNNA